MTEQPFSPGDADFSMWSDTAGEVTAQRTASLVSLAQAAVEPLWPYLSTAATRVEFDHRMGLIEDGIAARVAAVAGDDFARSEAVRHLHDRWIQKEMDCTANLLRSATGNLKIAGDGTTAEVMAFPKCDVCGAKDAAYDGKTTHGPWAYMCEGCFKDIGVGLGLGQGQRLVLAPSSKTSGLKDLDDGALEAEYRRVAEQQNNTRSPEAQEALRDWRRQVEQERAERASKRASKTAGEGGAKSWVGDYKPGSDCPYCGADSSKVEKTVSAGHPLSSIDRYKCTECGGQTGDIDSAKHGAKTAAATEEDLDRIADFDHPFTVHPDGSLSDAQGVYAPSVWHDPNGDIEIDGSGWEALTGFTGQYGYNGAVLHASEQLNGGLAKHILTTPGTYVVTSVEVLPEEGDDSEEPAGWCVLRYTGRNASKVSAASNVCPKCGATMDDVKVVGNTLTAKCDSCGWSGTKTRKASHLHTADTKASPEDGSVKEDERGMRDGRNSRRAKCTNCGSTIYQKGTPGAGGLGGWVHQSGSKWCPTKTSAVQALLEVEGYHPGAQGYATKCPHCGTATRNKDMGWVSFSECPKCKWVGHKSTGITGTLHEAAGAIQWTNDTHMGVGYLVGLGANGDVYECYYNPNPMADGSPNPTQYSWARYGPEGDTGMGSQKERGVGTSMQEVMRAAEANAAGTTASLHTAETNPPYYIEEKDGKFVVVNDEGHVKGTFDTKEEARQQQKALYANVPGASEEAERQHGNPKPKVQSAVAALLSEAADVSLNWKNVIDNGISREELLAGIPAHMMNSAMAYWESKNGKQSAVQALLAEAAEGWIDAARRVVANHQHEEVEGVLLDAYTASAMVQVYDGLSPDNAQRYGAMPLQQAADIAMKILTKAGSAQPQSAVQSLLAEAGLQVEALHVNCSNCGKRIPRSDAYIRGGLVGDDWGQQAYCHKCAKIKGFTKAAGFPRPEHDLSNGWARKDEDGSPEYWGSYQHGQTGQVIHMYRGRYNKARFYDDETGEQVGPEQANVAPGAAWALSNGYHNPDLAGLASLHTASGWIDAARSVLANHQHEEVDGVLLDATTASMLVAVYDGLSAENAAKFGAMPLTQAANLGWKLVSKTSSVTAVNESAQGTDRYQHVDAPERPSWITEWADAEMKASKEMTEQGLNAYVPPNPFPNLTTLQRVRMAAMKQAADDEGFNVSGTEPDAGFSEVGEVPQTGADAATGEDLEANPGVAEFAEPDGSLPQTTKPRTIPGGPAPQILPSPPVPVQVVAPQMGEGQAEPQMGSGGGFDMGYAADPMQPTTEQMVAAKVARIAERIELDNPSMDKVEARRLAALTVAKHPEMVKASR